jgi:hypothetical protein
MVETLVDKQHDLTIHIYSGNLTGYELLNTIQSFYEDSPSLYTLCDYSDASMDCISPAYVRELHSMVRKLGSARRGGKTAVVAPEDLEYGFARMFQIMSDENGFPFRIKVFRRYEEAMMWILEKE